MLERHYKRICCEHSLKLFLTSLTTMGTALYADNPTGLVGGQDNSGNAYAAFWMQAASCIRFLVYQSAAQSMQSP